jgi:hypothetical protein
MEDIWEGLRYGMEEDILGGVRGLLGLWDVRKVFQNVWTKEKNLSKSNLLIISK